MNKELMEAMNILLEKEYNISKDVHCWRRSRTPC